MLGARITQAREQIERSNHEERQASRRDRSDHAGKAEEYCSVQASSGGHRTRRDKNVFLFLGREAKRQYFTNPDGSRAALPETVG